MIMTVQFLNDQLRAFETLSQDRNPIHNDPTYARATQFGRPVVYGMCGVLVGLGNWARGRAFRLTRMEGRFAMPLFEQVEYELKISEEGDQVVIQYLEVGNVQMSYRFAWQERDPAEARIAPVQTPASFQPLAAASDIELAAALARWQGRDCSYSVRLECLSQLLPKLCLEPAQMPLEQLNALMGSSYLVGMEVPGRQALYSGFKFEFELGADAAYAAAFQFRNVSTEWDSRFNRFSVSGGGSGLRSFSLSAFQRPKHVRYAIEDVHRAVGQSDLLKNKVIFISGAARGFGAVLAKMFALQAANVFVNYRSDSLEAEAIAAEVRPWNSQTFPIAGDVSKAEDCRQIRTEIERRFGRIDLLVCNAFPQIPAEGFWEQGSGKFMRFLERAAATTVPLLNELMPLVPKGGIVLLVSTCYTREPEARFSHYIAAKSCLEGLMRTLAVELPDRKFVIVRPPRMLTDQTNLVVDLTPPVSAVTVARELMENLGRLDNSSNLAEMDLGRN